MHIIPALRKLRQEDCLKFKVSHIMRPCIEKKKKENFPLKLTVRIYFMSQAWWLTPADPSTLEAKAGGSQVLG